MRGLFWFSLLAPPACGQLAVHTVNAAGAETLAEGLIDLGRTVVGDTLETRFRIRNTGQATVQLTSLRVSGPAYSLFGHPTVPHPVAPGTNVDFTVRFAPAVFGVYSASLQVNDRALVLRATAEQGVTLLVESAGRWQVVTREQPVDFGRVERGQAVTRRFALSNDGTSSVEVSRLEIVSGLYFAIVPPLNLPWRIDPSLQRTFEIRFAPLRSGIPEAILQLDARTFRLQGVALEPQLPEPRITLLDSDHRSGRQERLQVRLAEPSRTTGTATLTMQFEAAVAGPDDPGVQLVRGPARMASLNIAEGDTVARWNGVPEVVYQTGTTAGSIVFRVQAGPRTHEERIVIPSAAVQLDGARASRGAGTVEVIVSGFDNARSADQVAFSFFDRADRLITLDPLRAPVADAFSRHYRESTLGGLFQLRAQFPVSGDISQLGSVRVEINNGVGGTRTERIPF